MRRVTVGQAVVGLLLLFAVSVGGGYLVGTRLSGGDDAATGGPATPTTAPATVAPPVTAPTTSAPTTDAPTTTAALPPATTAATTTTTAPRRPARIIMAGDSVMAGLSPPVEAALGAGGQAEVRFVLTPSILRDPTIRFTWSRQLDEFDPDLVVMFVGTWESGVLQNTTPDLSPTDPAWRAAYERDVLDPWLQLITSRGASVLWIGNPVVANPDANRAFATLDAAFADLPGRWPQVRYLPAGRALDAPDGAFHDVLAVPGVGLVRTRQLDGLHLCPDGAALLAGLVVGDVAGPLGLTVSDGWQQGPWRREGVYPPASCPPP